MSYSNSKLIQSRSQFVRTAEGVALNYTGAQPDEGLVIALALSVDPKGVTVKSHNKDGIETVSFKNSFSEGDLFCYVPVTEIGKTKSVQLLVDANGVKFANFTVQNTIEINVAGAKPASL